MQHGVMAAEPHKLTRPCGGQYRRDVGAGPSDGAEEHEGAGPVVLDRHQERPVELDAGWRRVGRPEASRHLQVSPKIPA